MRRLLCGQENLAEPHWRKIVLEKANTGRDHHPNAFTILMAGGGVRGGLTYGSTDEIAGIQRKIQYMLTYPSHSTSSLALIGEKINFSNHAEPEKIDEHNSKVSSHYRYSAQRLFQNLRQINFIYST